MSLGPPPGLCHSLRACRGLAQSAPRRDLGMGKVGWVADNSPFRGSLGPSVAGGAPGG